LRHLAKAKLEVRENFKGKTKHNSIRQNSIIKRLNNIGRRIMRLKFKLKKLFEIIDGLSAETKTVSFSEEAIIRYSAWKKRMKKLRANGALATVYSRADGQLIRVAGVLEHLKWAASQIDGDAFTEPTKVSEESVSSGIKLMDGLFIPAARELLTSCYKKREDGQYHKFRKIR
jgi:hypothetical protein